MARSESERQFDILIDSICQKKRLDIGTLKPDAAKPILEEAFNHMLLSSYAKHLRSKLSPIFAKSSDLDILRLTVANKHHWLFAETKNLTQNNLMALLAHEISEHNFNSDETKAVRGHAYSNLISEEWINYHCAG